MFSLLFFILVFVEHGMQLVYHNVTTAGVFDSRRGLFSEEPPIKVDNTELAEQLPISIMIFAEVMPTSTIRDPAHTSRDAGKVATDKPIRPICNTLKSDCKINLYTTSYLYRNKNLRVDESTLHAGNKIRSV